MRLPTVLVALLVLSGAAQAQRLEPLSRSGEAVTGRVTLSPDSIRFAGGKSLKLSLLDGKARGNFDTARPGVAVTARLYPSSTRPPPCCAAAIRSADDR